MRHFTCLLASTMLLAPFQPASATPATIAEDARVFGTRADAQSIALSPSGSRVLLIGAGPGRSQFLQVIEVATGTAKTILKADAAPEALHWCEFASDT